MDSETLRYWLNLAIGAPMALLWFVIVLSLAIYAAKGESPRLLRKIAIGTAVACGGITALYILLIAWNPVWYADWIGHVFFLSILLCYAVALSCTIWKRKLPQSPQETWMFLYESGRTILLVILIYAGTILVSDPPKADDVLLLIPVGLIAAVLCIGLLRVKQHLNGLQNPNGA